MMRMRDNPVLTVDVYLHSYKYSKYRFVSTVVSGVH